MSQSHRTNRRKFLQASTAVAASSVLPYWHTSTVARADDSPLERLRLGCIGTGDRWKDVGRQAMDFADCVAVCDVDALHVDEGRDIATEKNRNRGVDLSVAMYEDYRELLERDDIDVVTIVTPDHWHSKIAIEAMRAGKDVYCEKPLTLTIHEGKQIIKVLEETGRVFQVGTQQRTEMGQLFIKAVAMVRDGRIGEVRKVTCDIGGSSDSGEIPVVQTPRGLNWDMWLGQAPAVDFRFKEGGGQWGHSRCHYEFRWWYEYSGGKMTDWGAHHVDIASWALGLGENGPESIEGLIAEHPVPFENGVPQLDDRYNAATKFDVQVMCPGGVELHIVSESSDGNGILFEGTEGRFHVSRGDIKGRPVEDLAANPLPEGAMEAVYGGPIPGSHMQNFFDCIRSRSKPVSDVWSHHRAMTTCHLANIAIRLGRKLNWDSAAQQIVGDDEANAWLKREQRSGFEIDVEV